MHTHPGITPGIVRAIAVAIVVALVVPATVASASVSPTEDLAAQGAVFVPDAYEPDDRPDEAYAYDPSRDGNTFTSFRTFHGTDGVVADERDVVMVLADTAGTPIWIETAYLDGWYDTRVTVRDEVGTVLRVFDDNDFFRSTYSESAHFTAPAAGAYTVTVEDISGYPFAYELHITVGCARRVAGADRFATAAAVARLQWDNTANPYYGAGYGPQHIVVANGFNPADALGGGALAARLGGVLLLTETGRLPDATRDEIVRIAESRFWSYDDVTVHVLGGTAAVADAVISELEGIRYVSSVERIAGGDRYSTAAEIATVTSARVGVGTTAFLVNGSAWPDALAVAPVAAHEGAPVLMTLATVVPQVTLDWLKDHGVTDVVVVGGEGVVSAGVYESLDASYRMRRISGETRYETARAVAAYGVQACGMDGTLATLASGEEFADALAAAPIAWWTGAPLLLTRPDTLHPEVASYFDNAGAIGQVAEDGIGCYVLGGPSAVSDTAYAAFRDLWRSFAP